MTDEIDVLRRARAITLPVSPSTVVQERARRRQAHRAARALGAGALVLVAGALALSMGNRGDGTPVAADNPGESSKLAIEGATYGLPPGWRVIGEPDARQACVGPDHATDDDCPVLIAVTADPDAGPDRGLDAVGDLMAVCNSADPRIVTVSHSAVQSGASSRFVGRCSRDSETMEVWALESRSVYVMARDQQWAHEAANVFASVRVPDEWPAAPADLPSTSPTPGES